MDRARSRNPLRCVFRDRLGRFWGGENLETIVNVSPPFDLGDYPASTPVFLAGTMDGL
jgi:hypothetical protein